MMRLVFVNNAHPEAPHVSGMRLSRFAREMATRGHQVLLLTGAPPGDRAGDASTVGLPNRMATHDWSEPMIVEVAPKPLWTLSAMRSGRLPAPLRRALTAWHFLAHGGVFTDWARAAGPVADIIAREFKPDLVWATFGNTSNLTVAQQVAKRAGCPWVMDVKDNWLAFVPAGLRRIMARRFGNASGVTFNAEHHRSIAVGWINPARSAIIYSGVAEPFYSERNAPKTASGTATILLVGSTYSEEHLLTFLRTLKSWADKLVAAGKGRVGFHYAGTAQHRVEAAVESLGLSSISVVQGQVSIKELAGLARSARAACYLWASFGFHHKLLELLVVGTPVIAYPGEHAESRMLAARCDTLFSPCSGREELEDAFEQAWRSACSAGAPQSSPPAWRWQDFAAGLETFFIEVVSHAGRPCAE